MPPEADAPPSDPGLASEGQLRAQQDALAAYIRDPLHTAPPAGIEERRLKVYRELFFNNVEGLLAGNFPVLRRIYGGRWERLVRDFYRDHGSRTPLFTEIAREFLRYLEEGPEREPWLCELAHYEWIELALQISEARDDDVAHDPLDAPGADVAQALLDGRPALSPLAWPLAYAWPVHRIGPDHQPTAPPPGPTLLLVHRGADGHVAFHEPSALAWRLLQRLDEAPANSGREQLLALAAEAGHAGDDAFLAQGARMLVQWHGKRIVLGVHA